MTPAEAHDTVCAADMPSAGPIGPGAPDSRRGGAIDPKASVALMMMMRPEGAMGANILAATGWTPSELAAFVDHALAEGAPIRTTRTGADALYWIGYAP